MKRELFISVFSLLFLQTNYCLFIFNNTSRKLAVWYMNGEVKIPAKYDAMKWTDPRPAAQITTVEVGKTINYLIERSDEPELVIIPSEKKYTSIWVVDAENGLIFDDDSNLATELESPHTLSDSMFIEIIETSFRTWKGRSMLSYKEYEKAETSELKTDEAFRVAAIAYKENNSQSSSSSSSSSSQYTIEPINLPTTSSVPELT